MIYADDISVLSDRCTDLIKKYLDCKHGVLLEGNQEDVLWEEIWLVLDRVFDYPDYKNHN